METFDAVIIGAGPGGLRCATVLAQHGLRTLVLERKDTVGDKVCAGGIPFHALQELNLPADLQEGSFPSQRIVTPWQQTRLRFAEPVITTINRQRLGAWQQKKAKRAGAILHLGQAVTAISPGILKTTAGYVGYRFLIGADGSSSLVRRYLGLPSQGLGAGINYQVPGRWPEMEWHFNPRLFGSGYAWIFPHRQTTSIGAYADRHDLSPALLHQHFLAWAQGQAIDLSGVKARAALINFDYRGWNFKPVFLVGDAAGIASGFTGEGIFPAIVSGETVAQTILNPGYRPQRLGQLLKRQQRHNRLQRFHAANKVLCQISLEMLILSLRLKLMSFRALEMY